MFQKRMVVLALLLILSLMVSACQSAPEPQAEAPPIRKPQQLERRFTRRRNCTRWSWPVICRRSTSAFPLSRWSLNHGIESANTAGRGGRGCWDRLTGPG